MKIHRVMLCALVTALIMSICLPTFAEGVEEEEGYEVKVVAKGTVKISLDALPEDLEGLVMLDIKGPETLNEAVFLDSDKPTFEKPLIPGTYTVEYVWMLAYDYAPDTEYPKVVGPQKFVVESEKRTEYSVRIVEQEGEIPEEIITAFSSTTVKPAGSAAEEDVPEATPTPLSTPGEIAKSAVTTNNIVTLIIVIALAATWGIIKYRKNMMKDF